MYNITRLKCFSSRLAVVFALYIVAECQVENEDVVGVALTGDAPTTSEWSTIWLTTKVHLIFETWWYILIQIQHHNILGVQLYIHTLSNCLWHTHPYIISWIPTIANTNSLLILQCKQLSLPLCLQTICLVTNVTNFGKCWVASSHSLDICLDKQPMLGFVGASRGHFGEMNADCFHKHQAMARKQAM